MHIFKNTDWPEIDFLLWFLHVVQSRKIKKTEHLNVDVVSEQGTKNMSSNEVT